MFENQCLLKKIHQLKNEIVNFVKKSLFVIVFFRQFCHFLAFKREVFFRFLQQNSQISAAALYFGYRICYTI